MPVYKYQTAKGTRFLYKFRFNGKQYKKEGFTTQKEAKTAERERINKLEITANKTSDILFSVFYSLYKDDLKNKVTKSTLDRIEQTASIYILPILDNKNISEYTQKDMLEWQKEILSLELSETYKHAIFARLKAIFNHAVKYYDLPKSPCVGIDNIGRQNKLAGSYLYWTIDDWKNIEEFPNIEIECALSLLFFTGIRFGEMMALKWSDFDFSNSEMSITKQKLKSGEVTNTKTGETRDILLSNKLLQLLEKYKVANNTDDFIFANSREYYSRAKNRLCKKYNLPTIRMHDFRHSHATMLIMNNVSDVVVSERLGHASIQTTQRVYTHLYNEKKKEAIDFLESIE